jgi:hypothetical protein
MRMAESTHHRKPLFRFYVFILFLLFFLCLAERWSIDRVSVMSRSAADEADVVVRRDLEGIEVSLEAVSCRWLQG